MVYGSPPAVVEAPQLPGRPNVRWPGNLWSLTRGSAIRRWTVVVLMVLALGLSTILQQVASSYTGDRVALTASDYAHMAGIVATDVRVVHSGTKVSDHGTPRLLREVDFNLPDGQHTLVLDQTTQFDINPAYRQTRLVMDERVGRRVYLKQARCGGWGPWPLHCRSVFLSRTNHSLYDKDQLRQARQDPARWYEWYCQNSPYDPQSRLQISPRVLAAAG